MSKQVEEIKELVTKREQVRLGGGEETIEKQHARGKYTARERTDMLVGEGSFEEYDTFKLHRCHNFDIEKKQLPGDGVVTGSTTIDGCLVYVYAQDFTVNGGPLSLTMAEKICKIIDLAMQNGVPAICMNDSGEARIQEGICALAGYGEIFERNILVSGVTPQISVILGPYAGGAAYFPALTDSIMMAEGASYMFLTGPKVVKMVTGEDIDAEHLGGISVHAMKSGVTHFTAKNDEEVIQLIRTLLTYLPSNSIEEALRVENTDPVDRTSDLLNELLPDDPNMAYNVYKMIAEITDSGGFFEVQSRFAKNIITGFARFDGQSMGIVANQPQAYAGVLDTNASRKGACFVRLYDAFNIPIVSLVDIPGFLPGTGQEYNAVILHGAQLLYAYGETTAPKITITLRKSYGRSYIVMGCKQLRSDLNFVWSTAEIAVMGASGAVAVLSAKEAKAKKGAGEDVRAFLAEKEDEYIESLANPYQTVQYGYIDDVIESRNTCFHTCRGLAQPAHKRQSLPAKKHECMPMQEHQVEENRHG